MKKHSNRKILMVSAVFLVLLFVGVKISSKPTIENHFGITLPKTAKILATQHDTLSLDWSVAWLVETHTNPSTLIGGYLPKSFSRIPFSNLPHTKNFYYRTQVFSKMFDSESFKDKEMDIYAGGKNGNAFVAISKDKAQIIYYRFKT